MQSYWVFVAGMIAGVEKKLPSYREFHKVGEDDEDEKELLRDFGDLFDFIELTERHGS